MKSGNFFHRKSNKSKEKQSHPHFHPLARTPQGLSTQGQTQGTVTKTDMWMLIKTQPHAATMKPDV